MWQRGFFICGGVKRGAEKQAGFLKDEKQHGGFWHKKTEQA